ncbi:DUF748 domain-containing protein, partial [Hydrogenimonas sp.]|uniref:DUF748 domain-containing protein n=1 Tax=Hydrogenimonas sp. TaxID=2231112 RepID=UPI00263A2E08
PSDYGFIAYEIETKSSGIVRSFSKISLNPFNIEGELTVDGGRFDKINHYLKEFANLDIKEGTAELYLAYRASQTPHGVAAKIEEGRFALHGFRLDDPVSTPVTIGRFAVEGIEAAWPERTIHIGSVSLEETKLYASMDRKGKLSFEKWLKKSGKAKKSDTNASTASDASSKPWHITVDETVLQKVHTAFETPAYRLDADHAHTIGAVRFDTNGTLHARLKTLALGKIALLDKKARDKPAALRRIELKNGDLTMPENRLAVESLHIDAPKGTVVLDKKGRSNFERLFIQKKSPSSRPKKRADTKKTKPFNVSLNTLRLSGGEIRLDDRSGPERARLDMKKITAQIDGFAWPQKKRADFKLSLATPEKGRIWAKGKFLADPLQAELNLRTASVALHPYLPYIQRFVRIDIPKGSLDSRAKISYDDRRKPKAKIDYSLDLKNLRIDHADKKEKIFRVEKITLKPAKLELFPHAMKVDRIRVEKPYMKVHIGKNRSTNLDGLVVEGKKSASSAKKRPKSEKEDAFDYMLTKIEIENGSSDFSDLSLPLPFSTHIHDLNGEALGISSKPDNVAAVRLKGVVDKYGMANIKAILIAANPVKKSEVDIDFRNLDVTNLSPYTGKYIGYTIKDGRLWLKLKYLIDAGKLKSDNKIVLKKLELGDEVESNESIDAPIKMALALLKDSDGVIDLDIPVDGNVTDPKFKIGKVVWQAIGNMISGIVTAPFRFLGSMLGIKGEKLQYVDFEPGSDVVDPTEMEKLDKIVQIFQKRPLLKLELTGAYHIAADTRGIRKSKLRDIFIAETKQKKDEQIKNRMTADLLEGLYKKRTDYKSLMALKKAYRKELKQKNEKFDERKYLERLYEALLVTIPVTTDELKALGRSRAQHIADYMKGKGIEKNRTGIGESKPVQKLAENGLVPLKLGLGTTK